MKIVQLLLHHLDSQLPKQAKMPEGRKDTFLAQHQNQEHFLRKPETEQWTRTVTSDVPIETLAKKLKWQWKSWFSSFVSFHGSGHGLTPQLNSTCSSGFCFPISAYNCESSAVWSSLRQRMPPPSVLWKHQKHPDPAHSAVLVTREEAHPRKEKANVQTKKKMNTRRRSPKSSKTAPKVAFFFHFQF